MRFHFRSRSYRVLVWSALALLLAGCGPNQVGQYSPAKDSWDSAPTAADLDDLRHRAYYTQQDH